MNADLDNGTLTFIEHDAKQAPGALQRLPRKRLDLTINPRRGMDEGEYELQLSNQNGHPISSTTGRAQIENGLTVLVVRADLSSFDTGQYILRIRPIGSLAWRESMIILF